MKPALSARKVELLRRLATKEASRRQQSNFAEQTLDSSPHDQAGPSLVTTAERETLQEEEDTVLEHTLQEERDKNDVNWGKVQEVSGGSAGTSRLA
jgi:hypothetical protein